MVKENISLTQLFMLIFNFLLGSAIVFGIGKEAKQDAWIAIFLATLIGIGLIYFYYSISRLLPNKNLFEIMEYCFTRPIAILLSLVYVIYFLYTATRMIRTFGEMITTAILPNTPLEIITLSIMLVIAYIIYLGLEVLARVAEIFTPYIVLFLMFVLIFLVTSGEIQLHNIEPVLGDGMKPILKVIFPSLLVFPFGELVVFTIVFSSIPQLKKNKKVAFLAVLIAGTVLAVASLLMTKRWGSIGDRFGYLKLLVILLFATGLFYLPGAFITEYWQLVTIRFILGVTMGGLIPLRVAYIRQEAPIAMQGEVLGYNTSLQFLGNIIGPSLGGVISGFFGFSSVFFTTSILLILCGAFLLTALRKQAKKEKTTSKAS